MVLSIFLSIITATTTNGLEVPAYADTSAIVHHSGFTLEYAEKFEQAKWVAYVLTKERASASIPRTDNFRPDPFVATGSAQLGDYKNSGFDRGHLFPAGDAWDTGSMNDCFYLSNMSPQIHAFNAGIWEKLETQVRDWAFKMDSLFIVTAGVLRDGLPTIGIDSVAIPEYFYKAILWKKGTDVSGIGFILKSENSSLPLKSFAITIDSVERMTGIDFYPQLPDSVEAAAESHIDTLKWFPTTEIIKKTIHKKSKKGKSDQKKTRYFDLMGKTIEPDFGNGKMKVMVVENHNRSECPDVNLIMLK
jgi:endonuclease G, mitochondrial